MIVKTLARLPLWKSKTGCDAIKFTSNGVMIIIEYSYFAEGKEYIGAVHLDAVMAHKFANEPNTQGLIIGGYGASAEANGLALVRELIEKATDSVAEVEDSPWVKQMIERSPEHTWPFRKRHFVMDLSNNGFFEIIADDFKLPPPREGSLPRLDDANKS